MSQLPERYSHLLEVLARNAKPSEDVYHYTDWIGLKGILQSQQLWLTHYTGLNDTSEIFHAIETIRNYILHNATCEKMKHFWEAIFEDIHGPFLNLYDFFVFSFCKRRDYLHAWREYASDGAGFSIGFKNDFFIASTKPLPIEQDAPNFSSIQIFYDWESLKANIDVLVKTVEADLIQENALYDDEGAVKRRDKIAKIFGAILLPYLPSLKHEAYEGECEHRIYAPIPKSKAAQRFFTCSSNPLMPHHNSKERVFFQFDLKNISEIWIGPQLNVEHAKHDIEIILDELKTQGKIVEPIKIISSTIPYKAKR